jgi:hypothetical protein
MMAIVFKSNVEVCKDMISKEAINFLREVAGEIQGQAQRNSRVDTGQLKSSWQWVVDKEEYKAYIGSNLENAIWEEFGTGIYAEDNNGAASGRGRQTPWIYTDSKGNTRFTRGKTANHTLQRAFDMKKKCIDKYAKSTFGGIK